VEKSKSVYAVCLPLSSPTSVSHEQQQPELSKCKQGLGHQILLAYDEN